MPLYEFRCRQCDARFEVLLGPRDDQTRVPCPQGHADTVRLISAFATIGRAAPAAPAAPCGSACVCHPGVTSRR